MNKTKLLLNDSSFISALQGLQSFVLETGADLDMAFDWVCDQAEINSFAGDLDAFSCFYDVFARQQNESKDQLNNLTIRKL
jgi:hypothetical protein